MDNSLENTIYDIDNIINHIRNNTIELINKGYSKQQLLSSGIRRGKDLITGKLTKQTIVDLSSIGVALLLTGKE